MGLFVAWMFAYWRWYLPGYAWWLLGLVLAGVIWERYWPLAAERYQESLLGVLVPLVFILPLAHMWVLGYGGYPRIGGLLPWSDAAGYYHGALSLLEHGHITEWTARRPLATLFLTGALWLTGQNLEAAMLLIALLTGVGALLVCREVGRSLGLGAALISLLVLWGFHRMFVGSTMSEPPGLLLGMLGFVALWRGSEWRSEAWFHGGLFLLALGLFTRAGAMFVLPALLVWAGLHFARERRFAPMVLVRGLVVIGAVYALNRLALALVAPPQFAGSLGSNFAYSLYGLVRGGLPWTAIFQEHPELSGLPDPVAAKRAYRLAWEALVAHPLGAVQGVARNYMQFFGAGYLLGGLRVDEVWGAAAGMGYVSKKAVWPLQLAMFGVLAVQARKRRPFMPLLLPVLAGLLASAPFLVDGSFRVYAATVPFAAVMAAVGPAMWVQRGRATGVEMPQAGDSPASQAGACAGFAVASAFALAVLLLPLTLAARSPVQAPPPSECAAGRQPFTYRLTAGSAIRLVPDGTPRPRGLPLVPMQGLRGKDGNESKAAFLRIPPHHTLRLAYDLRTGAKRYLLLADEPTGAGRGIASACVEPLSDAKLIWRAGTVRAMTGS